MKKNKYLRSLLIGLVVVLFCVCFGVAGFMLIEHYTFIEALYMTAITLATVGFSEVKPLSEAGRIFTIVLIFMNLALFAYAITTVTTVIAEGSLAEFLRTKKKLKQMKQLNDHVIVCGFGRNGKEVCKELHKAGQAFIVIEHMEQSEVTSHYPNYLFLYGDATNDETLMNAGVNSAKAIISSLPSDPDNIFVVLTAREMNKNIVIVSRASNESSELKLKRAGANHVIMPERIGGSYMASLLLKPDISEFLSSSLHSDESEFQIQEIDVANYISDGQQHTIRSLHLREKEGLLLIGLKHANGHYSFTPPMNTKVEASDKLIVISKS